MYETELLEQVADTDAAVEFFACLDLQLNKVNQFYRTKEAEFLERGDSLLKQMEFLTELKNALKQRQAKGPSSQDSKEEESISGTISCGTVLISPGYLVMIDNYAMIILSSIIHDPAIYKT